MFSLVKYMGAIHNGPISSEGVLVYPFLKRLVANYKTTIVVHIIGCSRTSQGTTLFVAEWYFHRLLVWSNIFDWTPVLRRSIFCQLKQTADRERISICFPKPVGLLPDQLLDDPSSTVLAISVGSI